jgi:uncharacterized protein (TIRG00374 family)
MGKYIKLLGMILLVVILLRTDIPALLDSVKRADSRFLAAALLLGLGSVVVKSFRWWFLTICDGQRYRFSAAVRHYFSSSFTGLVTPGRLGEFTRVYYVKRDLDYPIGRAAATVVVDRLFDLYLLLIVGVTAIFHFGFATSIRPSLLSLLISLLLIPLIFVHPRAGRWFSRRTASILSRSRIGAALRNESDSFFDAMRVLLSWRLLVGVGSTVLSYSMILGGGYLMTVSLGVSIGLADAALLLGLSSLVSLLPISILGVGTRDTVFILGFMSLGLPESQALAYSAMVLILYFFGTALVGLVCFLADRPPRDTEAG